MSLPDQYSYANVRKSRKHHRFILLLVALSLFVCTGSGIFLCNSPFSPFAGFLINGCFPYQPEKIQNFARFSLPPSARNLESYCQGMQGWVAKAKFEMLPNDLSELIKSTMVKTPLSSTAKTSSFSGLLRNLLGDHHIASYLYGKVDQPEFLQEVLIDTTEPARYKVYIIVAVG